MPCYKFAPGINSNSFIFPTDHGWLYTVSFTNNPTLFQGSEVLENGGLTFEITFERSNWGDQLKCKDPAIQQTIQTILSKQFELQGILPIYFFWCDMKDSQQAARARLFTQWYQSCELEGWGLFNFELLDPDEDGCKYYAGLFIHADHPNNCLIPDAFERFLQEDVSNGKLLIRR